LNGKKRCLGSLLSRLGDRSHTARRRLKKKTWLPLRAGAGARHRAGKQVWQEQNIALTRARAQITRQRASRLSRDLPSTALLPSLLLLLGPSCLSRTVVLLHPFLPSKTRSSRTGNCSMPPCSVAPCLLDARSSLIACSVCIACSLIQFLQFFDSVQACTSKCSVFVVAHFRMSSAGSNPSANSHPLKRNSDDIGWEYGVLIDPNDLNVIKCKLCPCIVKAGIYRLKLHIAGKKGQVQSCPNATAEDKEIAER
jgi:hypothetical protein